MRDKKKGTTNKEAFNTSLYIIPYSLFLIRYSSLLYHQPETVSVNIHDFQFAVFFQVFA